MVGGGWEKEMMRERERERRLIPTFWGEGSLHIHFWIVYTVIEMTLKQHAILG